MTNTERVLAALQQNDSVSCHLFRTGFRLGARIYDLRKAGYEISKTQLGNGIAYYTLRKEP